MNKGLLRNGNVRRASRRYRLKYVYSALGILAVRSIYISTLGFLLAMPVQRGFKAWLMYGTCVVRAVPCSKPQFRYMIFSFCVSLSIDTANSVPFIQFIEKAYIRKKIVCTKISFNISTVGLTASWTLMVQTVTSIASTIYSLFLSTGKNFDFILLFCRYDSLHLLMYCKFI